jgi:glycosyltransferase involved in cell wall biosynthesis
VAALLATGVHKRQPTAIKLFAHHPNERVIKKLYTPASLVITESLLANERAFAYGLDPAKVLYLPHTYPEDHARRPGNRNYVERLAKEQGKSLGKQTQVIGCVGRLEYGKNFEFAIEAVRRLALRKKDIILVLKGDFPASTSYPDYQPLLSQMLMTYVHEPWLLWDRTPAPFPEVLEHYASFDLLLHPSGAEGASHVVVECLGLRKPVVLLDCSTNPYLFKGLATFVKITGEVRQAQLPFYLPDLEHLCEVLSDEVKFPDYAQVEARFHERVLAERIPLLFEPDAQKIKHIYADDRKLYSL